MNDENRLYAEGRALLLSGHARPEHPPVEDGARWGAAAVLRPNGPVLDRLAALGQSVGGVAGEGHWAHPAPSLHFTLRTLDRYRGAISSGDRRARAYAEAIDAACGGLPPARIELRGVCPHRAGVIAVGYPLDDTITTLQTRFAAELAARGVAVFETWTRNRWYVSLLHLAAPLADPAALVAWCDDRRHQPVGIAELDAVEIIRWSYTGAGVRPEPLHRVAVRGTPAA